MQDQQDSLVKNAAKLFAAKQFEEAKKLYLKASDLFGKQNFALNITLCEKVLNPEPHEIINTGVVSHSSETISDSIAAEQLAKTQSLLEYYFKRCQELEYKLLDEK